MYLSVSIFREVYVCAMSNEVPTGFLCTVLFYFLIVSIMIAFSV